ncbi:MAG: hypothetical protein H7319_17640 [Spirosoma sp.]|nr:hypothetical protein [Spirosoma sp.]
MKPILNTLYTLSTVLLLTALLTACEQKDFEPNYNAAPGGGTLSTYKAYTLTSTSAQGIYGRVVFYKYSAAVTLVQMGLYNTTKGTTYQASIYSGALAANPTTALKPLDKIDGTTGAFATTKYFSINEAGFYDKLDTYNASVKIMGTTMVASGNIGSNAKPVVVAQ